MNTDKNVHRLISKGIFRKRILYVIIGIIWILSVSILAVVYSFFVEITSTEDAMDFVELVNKFSLLQLIVAVLALCITAVVYPIAYMFFVDDWVLSVVKKKHNFLRAFFDEAVLKGIYGNKSKIESLLLSRYSKNDLEKETLDYALKSLFSAKPINGSKDNTPLKVGYDIRRDYLYIFMGFLVFVFAIYITWFSLLFGFIPLLVFISYFVDRMNKYGKAYYITINDKEIVFSPSMMLIPWEEIDGVSLIRNNMTDRSIKYKENKYELHVLKKDGRKIKYNISPFKKGWNNLYYALKYHSPMEIKIENKNVVLNDSYHRF